jgi:hypothetical protein
MFDFLKDDPILLIKHTKYAIRLTTVLFKKTMRATPAGTIPREVGLSLV